ncbi:MAG TPA: arsenosugar biosynthesis radical SAM (seleno)protein ArsS [Candidatus Binataceae bacterium]|nr:arsenosugar biosynthesis radical SAM (seleno)protein ArsS [Candidatus Binataceae bacterium]
MSPILRAMQIRANLDAMPPDFDAELHRHRLPPLTRAMPRTLQINVGKVCNQACHHCHVDAGPARTEKMERLVAERAVELLAHSPSIEIVDITGGAPELNQHFRYLVEASRRLERGVIVRCNLTVIFQPGMDWLPEFYRRYQVRLVCSLPCYTAENVTKQRGVGVFDKSIDALRILNGLGYGMPSSGLALDLVYNPVGAFLPPAQEELEARYHQELRDGFGVEFNHLLTITNMPISRFAAQLRREGNDSAYMALLVNHFNPSTVAGLMCRDLVSVGYEGTFYDCDFNQMLSMPIVRADRALTVFDIDDVAELAGMRIATRAHCFGCTAGAGSSCGGALA